MKLAAKAACFALLLIAVSVTAEDRSLTNSGFIRPPNNGRRNAIGTTIAAQQERVLLLESTVRTLTQSLALANREAADYKREVAELRLQLDALGLAKLDSSPTSLEQRMLHSARELQALQEKSEKARLYIAVLSEAMTRLLKESEAPSGIKPQTRASIETALKDISGLFEDKLTSRSNSSVSHSPPSLTNAVVLDQKSAYSLLVINIGERQGAKIGMPFQISRGGRSIGRAVIVDVRENISGAIIQNLESDENPVQTGDRLQVITR